MLQSSASPHPIYTGKPPADELIKKQSSSAALFRNSKVPARVLMPTFGRCFSQMTKVSWQESKREQQEQSGRKQMDTVIHLPVLQLLESPQTKWLDALSEPS